MKQKLQKIATSALLLIAFLVFEKIAFAQAPTITSFSPTFGPIGTVITIIGNNLNNLDTIKIGGVKAINISSKPDTLVAMVMPEAVTGDIYLSNNIGNTTSLRKFIKKNSVPPTVQQSGILKTTGSGQFSSVDDNEVCLSGDGNTAIIGSPKENSNLGAVHIYVRKGSNWVQQGTSLVGTGWVYSPRQGNAVSLSADGNTAIFGGSGDNNGKGAAWIFTRDSVGVWSQQGNKIMPNTFTSSFGCSVSLSADGNTAIIGGSEGTTSAFIFKRTLGVWAQVGGKLIGSGNLIWNASKTNVSISADGNTCILGQTDFSANNCAVWIFTRNTSGNWIQQGNKLTPNIISSNFGISVSINADGNTAVVGSPAPYSATGSVFVFTRNNGNWTQQGGKIVGTSSAGNFYGYSVSISADGNTIIVGGPQDNSTVGATWLFKRTDSIWTQFGNKFLGSSTTKYRGASTYISANGNIALIGGFNNGTGAAGVGLIYKSFLDTSVNLKSLSLSSGALIPNFNSANTSYSMFTNARKIAITSICSDTNASIVQIQNNNGTYLDVISGIPSDSINLNIGLNTIKIRVTAQDGTTIKTYIITVNRLSDNDKLSNINLIGTPNLPNFHPDTLTYAANVLFGINNIKVSSILADTSARIKIKINNSFFNNINNKDTSGLLPLNLGLNNIAIKVTAQDTNVTRTYLINITRAAAIPPSAMSYASPTIIATRTITNINNSVSYSGDSITGFSITPALPTGVSLNTLTGRISGAPTIAFPQTVFTITGTNSSGSTTANFTLTVNRVAPTKLKYIDSIVLATRTITNINSSVTYLGDSIANFSISPALPTGLSLNTITGLISGIPTVILPKTTFTITGTNNGGSTSASYTLTINNLPPNKLKYSDSIVIATRTVTNLNSSVTYSGDSITSFSITPSLPNGVSLNTLTGLISGTPTVTIPQTKFTITGTNNGGSTSASFTLTVNKIAPTNLKYSDSIVLATRTITNINSSVTYLGDSITSFSISPNLPNGVTINPLTGLISGTPTVTIPQTKFTITGTNNVGSTSASFTLTVNKIAPTNLKYSDSIVVATRTITSINSSVTYSGDSITSFSITPTLPNGVNLNTLTGLISGTPTVTIPQTKFTITGTNNGGSTNASFTLTVNKIAPTNLKYNDSIVIATRTITNLNSSVTYSGDSIDSFSITPSLPNGVTLNTSTGLISGIPTVNIPRTVFTISGSNNGGSTTASFTLTINSPVSIISINIETFSNINIKPNPFNNQIEIDFISNTKEITQLIILDAVGKEVFSKNLESNIGNNTFRIDELTYLKGGIYFARLANNNGYSKTFKLIKE